MKNAKKNPREQPIFCFCLHPKLFNESILINSCFSWGKNTLLLIGKIIVHVLDQNYITISCKYGRRPGYIFPNTVKKEIHPTSQWVIWSQSSLTSNVYKGPKGKKWIKLNWKNQFCLKPLVNILLWVDLVVGYKVIWLLL